MNNRKFPLKYIQTYQFNMLQEGQRRVLKEVYITVREDTVSGRKSSPEAIFDDVTISISENLYINKLRTIINRLFDILVMHRRVCNIRGKTFCNCYVMFIVSRSIRCIFDTRSRSYSLFWFGQPLPKPWFHQ